MWWEGFEFFVLFLVVFYKYENGKKLEFIEEVVIEVNDEYVGFVIEVFLYWCVEMLDMGLCFESVGCMWLIFICFFRGFVGYCSVFFIDIYGIGFMYRVFFVYGKYRGLFGNVRKGVLVLMVVGIIIVYVFMGFEVRGILFVKFGMEIYDGMIVGEYIWEMDLEINFVWIKELNNIWLVGKDENVKLLFLWLINLEEVIGYVVGDEIIEVILKVVWLWKFILDLLRCKVVKWVKKEL